MATNFEWMQGKVLGLGSDLNRTQVLSDLKIAISSQTAIQQKYIAQNLQLDAIFDCLNSSESEEIELACHTLTLLLHSLDSATVVGRYGSAIQRALSHPASVVKTLAITELQRAANDENLIPQLCHADLLLKVISCLSLDDLTVARCAGSLLVKIGKTTVGLKSLYHGEIFEGLLSAQRESDVVRFRVYEVVVEIAEHSATGLQASVECGLLPALIEEFKTDDVLLQLNALELLTKLAVTPHGLHYLEQHRILEFLSDKVSNAEGDIEGTIILPGLIKFFGNVAQVNPKDFFSKYPSMVTALFETLDSPDMIMAGVAMETVGYIATTVEGKHMLSSLGDAMNNAMKTLACKIANSPTEWRVRALNTVANIIALKVPDQDTLSLALTKSWFDALSPNPLETIMAVSRQPFPELRLAGLQVLNVLAEQSWGQEYMKNHPGLVEFLLDRSMETIKSCKDAKFDVIRTIVESPTAAAIFGHDTMQRLEEFAREGPFYVRGQTEVAIEGAS
ncbi:26S proteasome non-ATPase regulatory subunit 5 [Anabrus simplex]|uniref:26S proteasome non-ATPase regulatory subunit 5 n=1 Tax=Anabrus simplex TaxID=316456 RepID=UPI0035A2AEAC